MHQMLIGSDSFSRCWAKAACLVTAVALVGAAQSALADNGWTVARMTSPVDDSPIVIVSRGAAMPVPGAYGGSIYPELVLRCADDTTSAWVDFGDHFMSDLGNGGRVQVRLDDASAKTVVMHESRDNHALGLWRGSLAIPFIQSMFGAEMMLVRAETFDGRTLDVWFTVREIEAAVAPLRETCGW